MNDDFTNFSRFFKLTELQKVIEEIAATRTKKTSQRGSPPALVKKSLNQK